MVDESLLRLMVKEKGQAAAERQRLTFLFPFVHHQPRDESAAVPIGRPWLSRLSRLTSGSCHRPPLHLSSRAKDSFREEPPTGGLW